MIDCEGTFSMSNAHDHSQYYTEGAVINHFKTYRMLDGTGMSVKLAFRPLKLIGSRTLL